MTHIQLFKKLKSVFSDEKILLAGSCLLKYHNLIKRNPGDLDIICRVDNKDFIRFCKTLQFLFPVRGGYGYYTNNPNCIEHIQFAIDGIKVCVFTCSLSHFDKIKSKQFKECVSLENVIELKKFYITKLNPKHPSYTKHHADLKILNKLPQTILS